MFSNPLLVSRRRCYRRIRLRLLPGYRCCLICLLAGCRCCSLRPGLLGGFRCRRLHPRLLQGCCLHLSDHLRLLPGFRLHRLHRFRAAAVVASINAYCRAFAFAFASATTCACFRASASAGSTRCRAAAAPVFCLATFLAMKLFVYPASSATYKRSASLSWQ